MGVINVTPNTDITSLIASDNVTEGDVLLLEEGIYNQTVITFKDNIRIVAKGPGVIFDGKNTFFTAITLSDVTGVAVEGIKIRHFRASGILILSGSGNRILNNKFNNMLGSGIQLSSSSSNLIWQNEICNCTNGVTFTFGSPNNWLIENIIKECSGSAFQHFSSFDSNNVFISNIAIRSGNSGLNILGNNNLLLYNLLLDNGLGIVIDQGNNSVAIGNTIKGTKSNAQSILNEYRNYFAGENRIECNTRIGIQNFSQFGMFLDNEILYNSDIGMQLTTSSAENLVMDNKLVCKIPENVVDNGTDNNLINNMEKPCEPCKAPSDFCDPCHGESDNRFDESCSKTFKTKSRTCHRHLKERDSST